MCYCRKHPGCTSVPCGPAWGHTVQWPPCCFVCLHTGMPELSLACPVPKDVVPLQEKLRRSHYFIVMTMLLKVRAPTAAVWYGQFFKLKFCMCLVLMLWTSFTNFHRNCGSSGLSDGMFPAWTGECCSYTSIIGFGFVKSVQGYTFFFKQFTVQSVDDCLSDYFFPLVHNSLLSLTNFQLISGTSEHFVAFCFLWNKEVSACESESLWSCWRSVPIPRSNNAALVSFASIRYNSLKFIFFTSIFFYSFSHEPHINTNLE